MAIAEGSGCHIGPVLLSCAIKMFKKKKKIKHYCECIDVSWTSHKMAEDQEAQ